MKAMKKKFIAGIVAGAVLAGIGFSTMNAKAAENAGEQKNPPQMQKGHMPKHPRVKMSADEAAQRIHETFGMDEKEVKEAVTEGRDFRDIGQAAMLANITEKSFKDILAMKTEGKNWQEIAKSLGVTREQIEGQMRLMQAMHIGQKGKVDKDTALTLLNNGYEPRDIERAGVLAKAAGKDIQSVLDLKKINNSWKDVAAQLGVDPNVFKAEKGKREMRANEPQGGEPDDAMTGAPDEEPQDD